MWRGEYRSNCIRNGLYDISSTTLVKKNEETRQWTLKAVIDIPIGIFLGFYTGEYSTNLRESLYSAQLNNIFIYPFPDEHNITDEQRKNRPFANMNEPLAGENANCCMIVQDFKHDEIDGLVEGDDKALFFRGLACFTCADVKTGDDLTWYYGKAYEENRQQQGYDAGKPCELLTQRVAFIPSNSTGVLSFMPRVSRDCVIPMYRQHKSDRFKLKKRRRKKGDSSDSPDTDSSGSGHIPKYRPNTTTRSERHNNRQKQRSVKN